MENIKSLGHLDLHNGLKWEISLPLFHRSTVVLFTNLFLFRIISQVPDIFKKDYNNKNINVIIDGSDIKTVSYEGNSAGILVPTDLKIGEFRNAGEHAECIYFFNEHFCFVDTIILRQNVEKIRTIFNTMILELYQRI